MGALGPLPAPFRAEQALSEQRLIAYETLLANLTPSDYANGALRDVFGYGANI
jgi:hypothetical protein